MEKDKKHIGEPYICLIAFPILYDFRIFVFLFFVFCVRNNIVYLCSVVGTARHNNNPMNGFCFNEKENNA